jgi:starch phosphorylase
VRFGEVRVTTEAGAHRFTVEVYLGGLDPEAVRVELFANPVAMEEPTRLTMTLGEKLEARGNAYFYNASVPASRSAGDYTPRLVPRHPEAKVPLEAGEILWQR